MRTMTAAQKGQFWRTFRDACLVLGLQDKDEQAAYRHSVMRECCGKEHLNDLNTTTDYEAVMQRLAADAGDWARAASFMAGNARRIGAMVADCARQVFELTGIATGDAAGYAQGILRQSGLERAGAFAGEAWFMDYPEATPAKVFQMLDSHRRRLIRQKRQETGADLRLAYAFGTSYKEAM